MPVSVSKVFGLTQLLLKLLSSIVDFLSLDGLVSCMLLIVMLDVISDASFVVLESIVLGLDLLLSLSDFVINLLFVSLHPILHLVI